VQYFAYPEWTYERLREEYPDGRYESGADIGPDEWIRLRIEVQDRSLRVLVDGSQILDLTETKAQTGSGSVGLFVDIGDQREKFTHFLTIRRCGSKRSRQRGRPSCPPSTLDRELVPAGITL